jgi:hypothetical protein
MKWQRKSRRSSLVSLAVIWSIGAAAATNAATVYVDKDSTDLTPTGVSWAESYPTLTAGIAAAGNGDTIWVADGVYKPTTGSDRTISFAVAIDVEIYGGFQGISRTGGGESSLAQRNPIRNVTTLSGDIGTGGVATDNSYHVMTVSGVDGTALIDGFTITGGNANHSSTAFHKDGGGIRVENSDVAIVKCTFDGNLATQRGAALFLDAADLNGPSVVNCRFKNNGSTSTIRGTLYAEDNSVLVMNCLFHDNTAQEGAALMSWDASISLINSTVVYNTAAGNVSAQGGGLWVGGTHADYVKNCIFWGNTDVISETVESEQIFEYVPETAASPIVEYSIVQGCDTFCADPTNSDEDPDFVNVSADDYQLQLGSPAIDAGDDGDIPVDIGNLDQDGSTAETTPVDLNLKKRSAGQEADIVDMGAFEYQPCAADLNGDGDIDEDDLDILFGAWGNPGCSGVIPCPSDLSNDSAVDGIDSGLMLGIYGECSG